MSINQIIISTLSPFVPTAFHEYEGSETQYITFHTTNQRAGLSADNEELSTIYNVQIDLFGKGNIESLSSQVKTALRAKGFRRTSEIELYEGSTKTYQKSFSFINS